MPYKCEKIPLGEYDRRKKLQEEQKEEIRKLYETGLFSHNQLAKQFGVSKSLIGLIVNPDRKLKNDLRIKENWKKYQQTKEEHAASIRKMRRYKKSLFDKGLICYNDIKGERV